MIELRRGEMAVTFRKYFPGKFLLCVYLLEEDQDSFHTKAWKDDYFNPKTSDKLAYHHCR